MSKVTEDVVLSILRSSPTPLTKAEMVALLNVQFRLADHSFPGLEGVLERLEDARKITRGRNRFRVIAGPS